MAAAHAAQEGIIAMMLNSYPDTSQYNVVDSVDGPDLTVKLSGIIGVILTSMLFLVASWRLIHHFSAMWRRDCDEEVNSTQGITTKRTLHIFLWMTMLIEGGAYSAMVAHNAISKVNYMLLDIIGRGILEYWTFVFGTIYWFNIIAKASRSKGGSARSIYPVVLAVVTLVVTVSGALEAVSLSSSLYSSVDDFRTNSPMHRISLLVESLCWFIHAVVVTLCGKMVYQKISNLPTLSQVRSTAKRNIINKMIIPMVFCGLSYYLRSAWMAADFASRITSPESTFEEGVGYWVGAVWVSTFLPSIMLLYSIRKRDRDTGMAGAEGGGQANPLLHSNDNPFVSFQHNLQIDDESVL